MTPPEITIWVASSPSYERVMSIVPPFTSRRTSEWMASSPAAMARDPPSMTTLLTASMASVPAVRSSVPSAMVT